MLELLFQLINTIRMLRKKVKDAYYQYAKGLKITEALTKSTKRNTGVIIGKLSPGIIITDFIVNALGEKEKINLSEKTKKAYNILGDYPDVVAAFLFEEILSTKNGAKIERLTNGKAASRFITARFNKRDFFK